MSTMTTDRSTSRNDHRPSAVADDRSSTPRTGGSTTTAAPTSRQVLGWIATIATIGVAAVLAVTAFSGNHPDIPALNEGGRVATELDVRGIPTWWTNGPPVATMAERDHRTRRSAASRRGGQTVRRSTTVAARQPNSTCAASPRGGGRPRRPSSSFRQAFGREGALTGRNAAHAEGDIEPRDPFESEVVLVDTPLITFPDDSEGPVFDGPILTVPIVPGDDGPTFDGPILTIPIGPDDTTPPENTTPPEDTAPPAETPVDQPEGNATPPADEEPTGPSNVAPFVRITSATVDCAGIVHVTYDTGALLAWPRRFVVAGFEPTHVDGVVLVDEAPTPPLRSTAPPAEQARCARGLGAS